MATITITLNLPDTPQILRQSGGMEAFSEDALDHDYYEQLLKIYEALKRLKTGVEDVAGLIPAGATREVYLQATFPSVTDVSLLFKTGDVPGQPDAVIPYIYEP